MMGSVGSGKGDRRMPRQARTLFSAALLCVVLAGGAAVLPVRPTTGSAAPASAAQGAALTDLGDLDQLRALFNQREGVPRLVLLLSPT